MNIVISEKVDRLLKSKSIKDNQLGLMLILPQFESGEELRSFFGSKMESSSDYIYIWARIGLINFWNENYKLCKLQYPKK